MLNSHENNAPTVEERYDSATHASNLRVQSDRNGAADLLIAQGWNPARLGAALMRLHSEWHGATHPRVPTRAAISGLAQSLPRIQDGKRTVLDMAQAQATARDWHLHEVKILMGKLKTLPVVREQLAIWARLQMIDNADHRAAEILMWHLGHVCPACEGRCKELIPNTPSLSHRDCKVCRGSGETRIPGEQGNERYLQESKKLLRYLDDCIKAARTGLAQRMRPGKKIP